MSKFKKSIPKTPRVSKLKEMMVEITNIETSANNSFDEKKFKKAGNSYFKLLTILRKATSQKRVVVDSYTMANARFNLGASIKNEVIQDSSQLKLDDKEAMLKSAVQWVRSASHFYEEHTNKKQCLSEIKNIKKLSVSV